MPTVCMIMVQRDNLPHKRFLSKQKRELSRIGLNLCNHFDNSKHAKVKDSNAYATSSYLIPKVNEDPLLQEKFTLKDNKFENLVWTDESRIIYYQCFSDVLVFKIIYQKNKYNKSFVVFSRTNHNGQTCIFGCGSM
ncbi:hypothetical protein Ahy_B07g086368 [Arachis hypogaea]|uniref:Protein FAR1-RELATED SEQUENCE n=1 Tax=Arachis hypogaea TaxID=3818 RepID=A0A444Y9H0_ARAHY|nr:hypothetical protein Ahy_B07g086368 [Arachis hypogaea]